MEVRRTTAFPFYDCGQSGSSQSQPLALFKRLSRGRNLNSCLCRTLLIQENHVLDSLAPQGFRITWKQESVLDVVQQCDSGSTAIPFYAAAELSEFGVVEKMLRAWHWGGSQYRSSRRRSSNKF